MRRVVLRAAAVVAALACVPAAGAWTWPSGGAVLQPFVFDPVHPYAGGQHRGIDVGGESGSPVLAPAGGMVSFAGSVPTNGKSVTIQTPDGLSVTLVHLGSIGVTRNAVVSEGSVVGTIGSSGTAEVAEPYVHLGVRVSARDQGYLDPLAFLPVRGSPPSPVPEGLAPEPTEVPAVPAASAPEASAAARLETPTLLQVEEGANPRVTEPQTVNADTLQSESSSSVGSPTDSPAADPAEPDAASESGLAAETTSQQASADASTESPPPNQPGEPTARETGREAVEEHSVTSASVPVSEPAPPSATLQSDSGAAPVDPQSVAVPAEPRPVAKSASPQVPTFDAQTPSTAQAPDEAVTTGTSPSPEPARAEASAEASAATAAPQGPDATGRLLSGGGTNATEQLAVKPPSSVAPRRLGDHMRRLDHDRIDAKALVAGGHAGRSLESKLSVAAAVLLTLLALAGGGLALAGRRRAPQPTLPSLRVESPVPTENAAVAVEVLTGEVGTSPARVPLRCERVRIRRHTTGQNPRRRRVAVCGRTASHRSCGRLTSRPTSSPGTTVCAETTC